MELNVENIKKLSITCYNINFDDFKKIFSEAANLAFADDDYLKEKFIAFQQEGLDWLCRLDDTTATNFLNELLQKIN